MTDKKIKPPASLSKDSKKIYMAIVTEYSMTDQAGLAILNAALEAKDRAKEAESIVKRDGIVIYDRFNIPKAHPATIILRDSRAAMINGFKALNLSLEE